MPRDSDELASCQGGTGNKRKLDDRRKGNYEINVLHAARALNGEYRNEKIYAPGPDHSKGDRSLTVFLDENARDGYRVHSHAGDDWRACRDHVRATLGLGAWTPEHGKRSPRRSDPARKAEAKHEAAAHREDRARRARGLWSRHQPIAGTPAERYLRKTRGYQGPLPETLGFLPARGGYPPALTAAFGMASEPEPSSLAMATENVQAVQLIRLTADGRKLAEQPKITIGSPLGSPIMVAPPNDLLGLAITEGIEDALSVFAATGLGVWAAGGCSFMPALADAVPAYIDLVRIVADPDVNGLRYADQLADRLSARGLLVELVLLEGAVS
jgi:hypothetical protein